MISESSVSTAREVLATIEGTEADPSDAIAGLTLALIGTIQAYYPDQAEEWLDRVVRYFDVADRGPTVLHLLGLEEAVGDGLPDES